MEQETLFKGRDKRKKGWFWMDNDYLNGYAKYFGAVGTAIYVSLCRHADNETQKCFPAQETIAEELGIVARTVRKYLGIFEQYKIISIEREKDSRTKKWLNNVYTLLDKDCWLRPGATVAYGKTTGNKQQKPEATGDKSQRQQLPNKETHINKTHIKETNIATPERCGYQNPRSEYMLKRKNEAKKKVFNHYSGIPNKCALCGIEDFEVLTIDHENLDGNKHRKENHLSGGVATYAWLIRKNFPIGFRVLCNNCQIKIRKNQYGIIENPSVAGKEINDLIELFKQVNPSYQKLFANKTQRAALDRLVKQHGFYKIKWAIEVLPKTNRTKYAPTICTPLQLEEKLGNLIAFVQKERSEIAAKKIIKI